MQLEIRIDREACRGAGACVRRAPATFSLGEDGISRVDRESADGETAVRAAAAACPFFAIEVAEREG